MHEVTRLDVERRRAAPLLLPGVPLALIEEAVLHRAQKLLRVAAIAAVIRLVATGRRDARRMMEVVVPQAVEPAAVDRLRAKQARALRLVFADDDRATSAGRVAYLARHRGDDVRRRFVEDLLRRVESQSVEMKFLDPVARVA